MKISELIKRLQDMQDKLGDVTVLVPKEDFANNQPLERVEDVNPINMGRADQPNTCVFLS